MNSIETDVIICGAGISGLLMAKSLTNIGIKVACIEKYKRQKDNTIETDLRSTALLDPAISFFKEIGVWEKFEKFAQPLNSLVICNLDPKTEEINSSCEFFAEELGINVLGYNLPNKVIIEELQKLMKSSRNFFYLEGDYVEHITPRSFDVVIKTKGKKQITSKLIIAADGRHSNVRELLNIKKFKYDYNQQAFVFNIKHKINHDSKSYEIYKSEGPCTLVPLNTSKFNGHFSSVVLMLKDTKKNDKNFLNKKNLSHFITKRTGYILGECTVTSEIGNFPIITQASSSLISERLILLAETAHVLPPIGAQGLNTSIHDIKNLFYLIEKKLKNNEEIGDNVFLKEYDNSRKLKITSRMLSVHILNKLAISKNPTISNIRKYGLSFLNGNKISKKNVMKFGMFQ